MVKACLIRLSLLAVCVCFMDIGKTGECQRITVVVHLLVGWNFTFTSLSPIYSASPQELFIVD